MVRINLVRGGGVCYRLNQYATKKRTSMVKGIVLGRNLRRTAHATRLFANCYFPFRLF